MRARRDDNRLRLLGYDGKRRYFHPSPDGRVFVQVALKLLAERLKTPGTENAKAAIPQAKQEG